MNKDNLIFSIISHLTSDLLKPQFRGNKNKLWGHCYVASETFYHLMGGDASNFQPRIIKVNDINHWFLQDKETGEIIDITAGQFDFNIDYSLMRKCRFLTKDPSLRAKKLISRVLAVKECFYPSKQ